MLAHTVGSQELFVWQHSHCADEQEEGGQRSVVYTLHVDHVLSAPLERDLSPLSFPSFLCG